MTDQEGAAMTPDIVTEARRLLDGSVLWDDDHISNVLTELVAEVERLRHAVAAHQDCCGTDFWPELRDGGDQ